MPSAIIRTSNPADFTLLDGIYIDERRPPGPINGIGNNEVCVVGEFQRGPIDAITNIGSTKQLIDTFGGYGPRADGTPYPGYLALLGKRFSRLRVIRASNSSMVTSTRDFPDGSAVDVLQIDANSPGVWGNSLTIKIQDATDGVSSHFDVLVYYAGSLVEQHRNLNLADAADGAVLPGVSSDYVVISRIVVGDGRPANQASALALQTGTDGTFADSDFTGGIADERGIQLLYANSASKIRWVFVAERGGSTINAALQLLATTTKTKIVIIHGGSSDSVATVTADVANYRSDRVVYGYPWVKVYVPELDGVTTVAPNSFIAALGATEAPGRSLAGPGESRLHADALTGIRGLANTNLTNSDYITLREQRVASFVYLDEIQRHTLRSSITTSLDEALVSIERRTIADFLQESIGAALVNFQNLPMTAKNKQGIKSAITQFLVRQQKLGLLPTRRDLNEFRSADDPELLPFEIDMVSGNTPSQEASGLFVIFLRVRSFAHFDFIVLRTEIGQGVEIRVQEAA